MRLALSDTELEINLEGWEKILAVKGKALKIPLEHIVSVSTHLPVHTWMDIRIPGTFLPGLIRAGTYYAKRAPEKRWLWEFWYVVKGQETLTIELNRGRYHRIVLGVEDSKYWAERIDAIIQSR